MQKIFNYLKLNYGYIFLVVPIAMATASSWNTGHLFAIGFAKQIAFGIAMIFEVFSIMIIIIEVTSKDLRRKYLYVPLVILCCMSFIGNSFSVYNRALNKTIEEKDNAYISTLSKDSVQAIINDVKADRYVNLSRMNWNAFINLPITNRNHYVNGWYYVEEQYTIFAYSILIGLVIPAIQIFSTILLRNWLLLKKEKKKKKIKEPEIKKKNGFFSKAKEYVIDQYCKIRGIEPKRKPGRPPKEKTQVFNEYCQLRIRGF